MRELLIASLFFYAHIAISDSNVLHNKSTDSYIECNLEGLRLSRTPISERNFIAESSLEHLVNELLVAHHKELSIFLTNKNKIREPDYIDQAMEFLSVYLESEMKCFRDAYGDGDDVYKFQLYEFDSRVEGFAIVNANVKAVLYTVVVTE